MTPTEANTFLKSCIDNRQICAIRMKYENEDRVLCPLAVSENYFLAMPVENIALDGYLWDRLESIDRASVYSDEAQLLYARGGLFDSDNMPPVEIAAAQTFFAFLASEGCPVYVECYAGGRQVCFLIGRVENCTPTDLIFRQLSITGDLHPDTQSIPYAAVIRVSFGTQALNRLMR